MWSFWNIRHKVWAKGDWRGGGQFSLGWACPTRQQPVAGHTAHFSGISIPPWDPFQMNSGCWIAHLQLSISEQPWPSTRAVLIGGMFPGWDSSVALSTSSWLALLLELQVQIVPWAPGTDGTSFTSQGTPVSVCSPKRGSLKAVLQNPPLPLSTAHSAVNLPEELSWALSAQLKRKVVFTWSVPALSLSWTDNFVLALLPAYKEESCEQPCDKGWWRCRWAHWCLQISCVRGAVMWCKLWETSHIVLFIYSEACVGQISSIYMCLLRESEPWPVYKQRGHGCPANCSVNNYTQVCINCSCFLHCADGNLQSVSISGRSLAFFPLVLS